MKQVKAGMHVQTIRDVDMKKDAPNAPITKYQHLRVTSVTDQDTITVDVAGADLIALRLGDDPHWRLNRFGVGG